jgi:hypothetical protein
MTDVRWVAYHATRGANGEREDRRAGEFTAPDRTAAEKHARERLELARQREREQGVGKPKTYGRRPA